MIKIIENIENLKDVSGLKVIEIIISSDGGKVWINNEEKCLFKACNIERIKIDDCRE